MPVKYCKRCHVHFNAVDGDCPICDGPTDTGRAGT
jgi:RNA polymerase subunit RPABC4/transcription elongation factor Spt4